MRRLRESRGLRQDELAAALGVTPRYIGMIERGQKDVEATSSLYKLFLLIEANKIPVEKLGGDDESTGPKEEVGAYRVNGTVSSVSVRDALDQVKADLHTLEHGTLLEKRRTMTFLRDVHLPILARALKLE